ncbi:phage baseplate assembly protein domain-containing protein [Trabulsiella odontotermitis]|uniref:Baseplate assembly protein n=1 Tax=Trabulsiella odontotermitis TaxID=379893 RepID=A0A0L0GZQ2_9ENTR|nr:phage baseplate assembly protein [Trabulsiella odontotermitis]KNC94166.1 baseplate assembly protein [Trabulsiella odontotermitis]
MNDVLSRLYRRITMLVGIGRTTGVADDSGTTQTLQYKTPFDVRGNTLRMTEFGFSSGLPAGSDVLILSLGGDRSSQVIVATNHGSTRYGNLNPGETVIYDAQGKAVLLGKDKLTVKCAGQDIEVLEALNATITASVKVRLETPLVESTGDIVDNCESNQVSMKALREAYNLHGHDVKNVQAGNDSRTSEKTNKEV